MRRPETSSGRIGHDVFGGGDTSGAREQLLGPGSSGVIGDHFGGSHHEHAPALVPHRIELVDLEGHDRVQRGAVEARRPGGVKDDVAFEHGVAHGEHGRDRSDRYRHPPDAPVAEEREACGAFDGELGRAVARVQLPERHRASVPEPDRRLSGPRSRNATPGTRRNPRRPRPGPDPPDGTRRVADILAALLVRGVKVRRSVGGSPRFCFHRPDPRSRRQAAEGRGRWTTRWTTSSLTCSRPPSPPWASKLVDVERRSTAVRVVVDRAGGVDLEAIAAATRAVSAVLDAHDPFPGQRYTLEVSSPGVERRLRTPLPLRARRR